MSTFEEILNMRMDDIAPPKPLPEGVYLGIVDGQFVPVKSNERQTPGFQFNFKLVSPIQVSDTAALEACGGCAGKNVKHTVYISDGNEYYLKQFLVNSLGIDGNGKSITEGLSEAPGRQAAVHIKQTVTKGNDPRLIHIVDSVAKL